MVGGVFGLLGGYLTDLLGRRRVLTFSILLYALSAFAAGFVTSLEQLLVLRCAVFVGVCVEFVAAVAWLAELFDDPKQREKVLGYTQAFSSVGGILVAGANVTAAATRHQPAGHPRRPRSVALHADLRRHPGAAADPHPPVPARVAGLGGQARRRPAAPAEHRRAVQPGPAPARRWSRRIVFAASYGIAFGAIQQLPQILGAPNRGHVESRWPSPALPDSRPSPMRPRRVSRRRPSRVLRQSRRQRHRSGRRHRVVVAGDGRPRRSRRLRAHRRLGDHAAIAASHLPDPGPDLRAAAVRLDLLEPRRRRTR